MRRRISKGILLTTLGDLLDQFESRPTHLTLELSSSSGSLQLNLQVQEQKRPVQEPGSQTPLFCLDAVNGPASVASGEDGGGSPLLCAEEEHFSQHYPQPQRCIMWLNWVTSQFLPPSLVRIFLMDLLKTVIPGIYDEWAFPVQVLLWVSVSVTTFTFYASSWIPPGRVSEKDLRGREVPNNWSDCTLCHHSVPIIARHCHICQVCIWERDHHCFFTGNCVGRDTIRVFKLLCLLTATNGFLYIIMVMAPLGYKAELQPKDWFLGFVSSALCLFGLNMYNYVEKRRTRMKERYPMFFEKQNRLTERHL